MTKDEALKLALEALESDYTFEWPAMHRPERAEKKRFEAITAIKQALAQPAPVQEPVAWPCEIEEADFEQDTITLKMLTSEYVVRAGKHWLSTTPPAAQPAQERNFCPRCGKRTPDLTTIHTCTPPQEDT